MKREISFSSRLRTQRVKRYLHCCICPREMSILLEEVSLMKEDKPEEVTYFRAGTSVSE